MSNVVIANPDDGDYPHKERPELVEYCRKKRPLHTGKIKGKDAYLCRSIALDLISGQLSKRQIAAKHEIGRNTLEALIRLMNERGEMEPIAKTISAKLGNCISLMLMQLEGALLNGEISSAQMPIALCALIDKKGQLDAGMVPGTNTTEAEAWESAVDVAWRAWKEAKGIKPPNVVTIDSTIMPTNTMPGGGGGLSISKNPESEGPSPRTSPGQKDPQ